MKLLLRILFFLLLATQICFAQWFWQNPLPQGQTLRGVKFISSTLGWAVGDDGTIIKTTDGGTSWTRQLSGTNDILYGLFFTDENHGLAVGGYYPYNGSILRTSNGGDTWVLNDSVYGRWLSVFFTDQFKGTVVGSSGKVIRTTDAGTTWVEQTSGVSGNDLNSVFFTDEFTGIAVGTSGVIIKTTNGGTTWTQQSSGTTALLYGVWFTNSNNGVAVGETGIILRTTNGGLDWTQQITGTTAWFYGVSFTDANNGIAVGDAIIRTTDGGISWNIQSFSAFDLYGISLANFNIGTAVGSCGRILRTTDGGTNWASQTTGMTLGLNAVSFANTYEGLTVGEGGTILKTTNAGNTWTQQMSGTTYELYDVTFIDASYGTTVGESGIILRTTNGGIDWAQQTSGTIASLYGVSFTDVNTGTVVGSGGKILRTTSGGVNWFTQTSGTTQSLNAVSFTDVNTGTVVGSHIPPYSPAILRTTNGGVTWTQQNNYINADLYGVCFTDANNGTAVGTWGRIIRTTNGGVYWEQQTAPFGWHRDVCFIDENVGYVVGTEILKTTDAGASWVMQQNFISPGGTGTTLSGVHFTDVNTGTVVGDCGSILRTLNGGVPVELIFFTASVNDDNVILSWSTATETNNQGFEVERQVGSRQSAVGNSVWKVIGFVSGFGTTTEPKSYSFTDDLSLTPNLTHTLRYRLKQIDFDGSYEYSQEVEVEVSGPFVFALEQNYPNPFNPSTVISYQLPVSSDVTLKVYDVLGNDITKLVDEFKPAGRYQIEFNSHSGNVRNLTSGVYFYQLKAGEYVNTKKMILLK